MTAFIWLPQHDRAHVVSDSAVIDIDGTVIAFAPKSLAIPHHPSVILTRGSSDVLMLLGMRFNRYSSFDDMVEKVEAEMPGLYDELLPIISLCGIETLELYLTGWSAERSKFECYMLRTSDKYYGMTDEQLDELDVKATPFELTPIPEAAVVPTPDVAEIEQASINPNFLGLSGEALRAELRKLLELQRRAPQSFEIDGPQIHAIGGWANISTITPKSVSQEIFHRWPEDKIGSPIEPGPLDFVESNVTPIATAGMSRQQRRYFERQQRRKNKSA